MTLDPSGSLYMPAAKTIILSGLVMTRDTGGTSKRRRNLYQLSEKMAQLDDVLTRFQPEKIIVLGGAPLRREDFADLEGEAHEVFFSYFEQFDWYWIGSTPEQSASTDLGVQECEAIELNGFTLRHRPLSGPMTHEIAGYLNPAAFVGGPGYAIRRPCFVSNGRRLVLPRFGSYAGGENVLDKRFKSIFADDGLQVWMLGYEGVQTVACRQLRTD